MAIVPREFDLAVFSRLRRRAAGFPSWPFWESRERVSFESPANEWSVSARARRWPSVATMAIVSGFRISQRAVQRVTRLFHGNGKGGLGNQRRRELPPGIFTSACGNAGMAGKIILGHAHHLVGAPVRGDLHPMVFEQLEANLALRQQAHQVEQLFRGNGARRPLFLPSLRRRYEC